MTLALNLFTIVAVAAGAFFFLAGTVGLLRFPDALTRLHALTKADNLGLGLVVLGLLAQADGILAAMKLIAVWLLAQVAGATVTQMVARGGAGRAGAGHRGVDRGGRFGVCRGGRFRFVRPVAGARLGAAGSG
jgi:multicomponent Na+:H+ antiporter subunit G